MGESLESGGREEKWSRAWHGIDGGWIPLNIHDLQRWADGPDNHQCTSGVPCSVCMEMAGQLHHYFINSFTHTVRHEAHTEYYPQRQQTSLALMWKGKKKWKKKKRTNDGMRRIITTWCSGLVSWFLEPLIPKLSGNLKKKKSWNWSYQNWSRKYKLMRYYTL